MRTTVHALMISGLLFGGCAAPEPTEVRVLCYNIRHGRGMDGAVDLERIAAVIRAADPDLVALQEVDRGVRRTDRVDQPARLGELTGMTAVFEKNIDFQGGEYGNAILTRLPIVHHTNHHLPQVRPNEQRGMLEVRVRAGPHELVFLNTHFDSRPDDTERMASVELFEGLLRTEAVGGERRGDLPVILTGDINATPDSRVLQRLFTLMHDACPPEMNDVFTFRSDNPTKRIDYILYNDHPDLRCLEYQVIDEPMASDHRPILAVFELRPASR